MKHIRKFNESKDEKMINTIKDILIEFEDKGFETEITYETDRQRGSKEPLIKIIIDSDSLDIDIDDVDSESIFKMLFEYLECLYELRFIRWSESLGGGSSYPLYSVGDKGYEIFHEVLKNKKLSRITLYFEKRLQK